MARDLFDGIDAELRKDAGCSGELDYIEQTSWLLFLKYLESLEFKKQTEALLSGNNYTRIISEEFRWEQWAAPKKNGHFDHASAMTGDDLLEFVNDELFPYLASFGQRAEGSDTIEYKIGEIFSEIQNKCQSGYTLRAVVNLADEFVFGSDKDMHEMSSLYEAKINRMGNAGRNGGEYYTPRPMIRAMISIIDPKIGETIYDGAVGSAGFLCEAHDYLKKKASSTEDLEILQKKTYFGKEKKALSYIIGTMNMILHGIDAPNLIHTNTLNEKVMDLQNKDRHDIILANPPFGGSERKEVQMNFIVPSSETSNLFLQHFIAILKLNGRAAIVVKRTLLSNPDSGSVGLRKRLLETCDLHTILLAPKKAFPGTGEETAILFFTKGMPTKNIWYYKLEPGRVIGKKEPLSDLDLEEFLTLQSQRIESEKSWVTEFKSIDQKNVDLYGYNPNIVEKQHKSADTIIDGITNKLSDLSKLVKKLGEIE